MRVRVLSARATRLRTFLGRLLQRPHTAAQWAALSLVVLVAALGAWSAAWVIRYASAIHRLGRGVGDTVFYDGTGKPWFRMDEQRHDVSLDQIAPDLQHAVVAVEDRRFFHHPGVDPIAIFRAAWHDLRAGERSEGASTLTQQLARTLFLSNTKTFGRKIKEAALATVLEAELSKRQILELYLNRVYLSGGVYGAEPMAEKLFDKHARDLTLAESALIAGLIRAPSALSPWSNLDAAVKRSHTVLALMREEGFITPAQESAARRASIRIRPYSPSADARGGYAKEYLRQAFRAEFDGDHPPDWRVQTTFIPALQDAAEQAVASGLRRAGGRGLQAALVAIEPGTGNLIALVGGRDFRTSTYNRAVRASRQPGSAFKPFVYAAALERGFTPVSVLTNLTMASGGGPDEWVPRNAHGDVADALTLRAALLESNNQAAAALQQRLGARPVIQFASAAGLPGQPDVPSLALGTGLVTPLDLAAAYSVFPNGGFAVRPRGIVQVTDGMGRVVFATSAQRTRILSPQTAFQMVSMLEDVVQRGTGAGARQMGVRFPVAGKTGTTDDFHDAWFVGFSSSLVAAVWVGYDEPKPIGREAYGAQVALPIWAEFMRRASTTYPPAEFAEPEGLRQVRLCEVSYLRPAENCPTYVEYFKEGDDVPTQVCPIHRGLPSGLQRVADSVFGALGRRLKHLFGR